MTAKILNLDEFETVVEKVIVLNGERHALKPFSVADFLANLKQIEEYSKRPDLEVSVFVEHMVTMVKRGFPTITQETLDGLSMEKLKAINEFIRGQTEAEAEAGLATDGREAPKNEQGKSN